MNYYLHRISQEAEWSHSLLKERCLLSIGWSEFSASKYWLSSRKDLSLIPESVAKFCQEAWEESPSRSRFDLQRFLEMKKGDRVVVPTGEKFHVYEVSENQCLVPAEIKDDIQGLESSWSSRKTASIKESYITEDGKGKKIDLGFFRRVIKIEEDIPRAGYADAELTKRMKARQTNLHISHLKKSIEDAITAFRKGRPINLREKIFEKCAPAVHEIIVNKLNPDKFEKLIKLFFERQGANVTIPSKNKIDKEGDADVVAEFDLLNLVIYIQAKHHEGETNEWAVQQISSYKTYIKESVNSSDSYNRITWVISTAEGFSKDCEKLAKKEEVRLINGLEFSKMLLDAGIDSLDYSTGV